jgi:hypothetical protein
MSDNLPIREGQTLEGSLFNERMIFHALLQVSCLNSGELRLIEVKGIGEETGTVLLTPNERRAAEDRRDCYWLYVVTNCDTKPKLQEPIKDPAKLQWNEVTKVAHYYLAVNAMTQPMQVSEDKTLYEGG